MFFVAVQGWVGFTLLSELPSFLTSQLGFSLSLAGELCIVPYACLYVATVGFGELFTHLQKQRGWQTRTVRQCAHMIAYVGAPVCLVIAGFVDQPYGSFAFLVLAQVCGYSSMSAGKRWVRG